MSLPSPDFVCLATVNFAISVWYMSSHIKQLKLLSLQLQEVYIHKLVLCVVHYLSTIFKTESQLDWVLSAIDILSTTTTLCKEQPISFLSLKNRIIDLLRIALTNETDATNTQMLLGMGECNYHCLFYSLFSLAMNFYHFRESNNE